jgi:hypothetical protein
MKRLPLLFSHKPDLVSFEYTEGVPCPAFHMELAVFIIPSGTVFIVQVFRKRMIEFRAICFERFKEIFFSCFPAHESTPPFFMKDHPQIKQGRGVFQASDMHRRSLPTSDQVEVEVENILSAPSLHVEYQFIAGAMDSQFLCDLLCPQDEF